MSHYLEIHLQPDPELPPHVLMAELFTRLHRRLTDLKADGIGLVFPDYQRRPPQLGSRLRLVGSDLDLRRLLENNWLGALHDHTRVSVIAIVPPNVEHRALRRTQAKSSPTRLRRRQIKRHGLSAQEAMEQVPDSATEHLRLPFVQVRSASTGQTFRLFFGLSEPLPPSDNGRFNAYGLSTERTIPWF